ncbi:MAG: DNA repair exonuclease [Rhodobacteraceae bacterium]|nr:DNA repair exonuclease [Paracoccaceae bacterium]
MFRLLHSSDLHLGKPFGRYPEAVRNRLQQARHDALGRLAGAARDSGAGVIVLAGDTFDAETPAPQVLRQALNEIRAAADLTWIVMPGNHDSLAATELWRTVSGDCPNNLCLALTADPIEPAPGVWLLPAPCTARNPGRDLTDAMDRATPEGALRIGLGHGGIRDFTAESEAAAIIPPDRAARSGLDYLALGDWHGQLRVSERCWYAGTPEADSFKHSATPASALAVGCAGPGAVPDVVAMPTGGIEWRDVALDLRPGDDGAAMLAAALPDLARRRDCMLAVAPGGRIGLQGRADLAEAMRRIAPDFLHLAEDMGGLRIAHAVEDLDLIDRAGALRSAAAELADAMSDPDRDPVARADAEAALGLLFDYAAQQP